MMSGGGKKMVLNSGISEEKRAQKLQMSRVVSIVIAMQLESICETVIACRINFN